MNRSPTLLASRPFRGFLVLALGLLAATSGHAQIYVLGNTGTISKYNADGTLANGALITDLSGASDLFVSGSNIYVSRPGTSYVSQDGSIGQYTVSGSTVNSSLATGLQYPTELVASGSEIYTVQDGTTIDKYPLSGATENNDIIGLETGNHSLAVSGSSLFISSNNTQAGSYDGIIGQYSTSGTLIDDTFISLSHVFGILDIATSGSYLFVLSGDGTIGEYTTSGTMINPSLITGLYATKLEASGSNLFVLYTTVTGPETYSQSIGEFTTSGAIENIALVSGLNTPVAFAVDQVPEASTWAMMLGGLSCLLFWQRRCPVAA